MMLTTEELLLAIPNEIKSFKSRIQREGRREAWLASRRGRLTASAIEKLFTAALKPAENKTARQYIYEKVAEKLGAEIPFASSRAMQWGNDQEPFAVIEYMKRTGEVVTKWGDGEAYEVEGLTYQSDGQEFLIMGDYYGATPDGLILPGKTLQVKCPYNPGIHLSYLMLANWEDFKKYLPGYFIQVQVEMMVAKSQASSDVSSCDFVSYDPRVKDAKNQMKIINIPIDEDFQVLLNSTLKQAADEIEAAIKALA